MVGDTFTDYCADQVKRHHYEHYVLTLFMPAKTRPWLWALYAFELEMARIPNVVMEPMLARIRFQWWREAIERLYQGQSDAHEVLRALKHALQAGVPWRQKDLQNIIHAYEAELEIPDAASTDDMKEHMMSVYMPLMRLACQASGHYYEYKDLAHMAKLYGTLDLMRARKRNLDFDLKTGLEVAQYELGEIQPKYLPRILRLYYRLAAYHIHRLKKLGYLTNEKDHLLGLKLAIFSIRSFFPK